MAIALLAVTFVHLWTHAERGWMLGIPTVARGVVYEGTTTGDVLALDERDGNVLWRASLGANPDETYGNPRGVISSVAVRGGIAYAVSGSCEAAALDANRGTVIWQRRICSIKKNDDTFASPAIADGRALFSIDIIADRPTDAGREVALDAATGAPAWAFSPVRYQGTGGGISGTPAVDAARGLVIIGTGNPTPMSAPPPGPDPYTDSVIAVDARTGRWRWVTQLLAHDANDFDVFTSPQIFLLAVGGRQTRAVGVTLKNSRYCMLDERTGKILWRRQLVGGMHWMQSVGTPASGGKIIVAPLFHSSLQGELVAINENDGSVVWRAETGGIYEEPVIWHGVVLVAEADGTIAGFDLRDGRSLRDLTLPSEFYGRGLALDGDVLLVAGRGKLWAYRLEQ
ncbi:MAG TPA: PQQ-binding-like beta-propeller repeat protein [Candidatus Babeliales bacterium]|nr:PQQ-binding-like beta-propeller repeat protein [Candidatus Babeliales bacterium]